MGRGREIEEGADEEKSKKAVCQKPDLPVQKKDRSSSISFLLPLLDCSKKLTSERYFTAIVCL